MGKLLLLKEAAMPVSGALVSLYPSLSLPGLALAQVRQSFLLRLTLRGVLLSLPQQYWVDTVRKTFFLGDFEVEEVVMWEQSSEGGKGVKIGEFGMGK